jgi:hypothetical protein
VKRTVTIEIDVPDPEPATTTNDTPVALSLYAAQTGCELKALKRAARGGAFPVFRISKKTLAKRADLDRWVLDHAVVPKKATPAEDTIEEEFERAVRRAS